MIYRVSYECQVEGHQGFTFHSSRRAAVAAGFAWRQEGPGARETPIDARPTPSTKAELLALLSAWGAHPDNG